MYDDHLEIVNPGVFHFGVTPEKLKLPHESHPWNPLIANVFYRTGIIEKWGTGTLNIIDLCLENGNPEPDWKEQTGSVVLTFFQREKVMEQKETVQVRDQVGTKSGLSQNQINVICNLMEDKGITDLMLVLRRSNRTKFRDQVLNPLIEAGLIEMTIPDKPRSSLQKYRLTAKGRDFLIKIEGKSGE